LVTSKILEFSKSFYDFQDFQNISTSLIIHCSITSYRTGWCSGNAVHLYSYSEDIRFEYRSGHRKSSEYLFANPRRVPKLKPPPHLIRAWKQSGVHSTVYILVTSRILDTFHNVRGVPECSKSIHIPSNNHPTEAGVPVMVCSCIPGVVGLHLSRISPAIPTELLRDFPQYTKKNSGIVSGLGHDRFLPNPFKFIVH
jgi:hypothetical protein